MGLAPVFISFINFPIDVSGDTTAVSFLIINGCVSCLVLQASDHDTNNFDPDFTMEVPKFTPTDKDLLQSMDQGQFRGFSFVNPYFGTQH